MPSSRGALFLLLQSAEVIGGTLRVGGGEYRPLVFLQHRQPVTPIGGVVVAHFRCDAQFRAQERGSEFPYQFLACAAGIPEPLRAKIRVQPVLSLRCVRQFMQGRGVIAFFVPERLEGRKLHTSREGA